MRKKSVLIIYPDPYLSFSPTTLNLYDHLSDKFDVTILTFEPDKNFSQQKIHNKNIKYLKPPRHRLFFIFQKIISVLGRRFKFLNYIPLKTPMANLLIKEVKRFGGVIIAVDFFAAWCVQQAGKQFHLLSLEIFEKDVYREKLNLGNIFSVIIQSEIRYNYLFGASRINTFYIQNAPVYLNYNGPDFSKRNKYNLIYCGSAVPAFGLFSYLEFLIDYPEYTLTVKGAIPPSTLNILQRHFKNLLDSKRLILNEDYLMPSELNDYLSTFRIGFVFYDYVRYDFIDKFNYHTAPSGKLFQYYNAGIPVIGNSLVGLKSVEEFKAGVLISGLGSLSIKKAIDQIEDDYFNYSSRSKEASKIFDFNKVAFEFSNSLL